MRRDLSAVISAWIARAIAAFAVVVALLDISGHLYKIDDSARLSVIIVLIGIIILLFGELYSRQLDLVSEMTAVLRHHTTAYVRQIPSMVDKQILPLVEPFLNKNIRALTDIVEHGRFVVPQVDAFRAFYIDVLNSHKGSYLLATSLPNRIFFWNSEALHLAMRNFIADGGHIDRVFFIRGGLSGAKPSELFVVNEQHKIGVKCYIANTELIPDDLLRFFLVAKDFDLGWEPNRGPNDVILGITVTASVQSALEWRDLFHRITRLHATQIYTGEVSVSDEFHEFELTGWEQSAAAYDRYFSDLTDGTAASITKALEEKNAVKVLDVACGPGRLTHDLISRGVPTVGVDFSESMVQMARRSYPDVNFEVGDAHKLKFAAGSFDTVIMNFGILHLAWPEKALLEAFRILSKGGRLLFTVWNERSKGFRIIQDAIADNDDDPAGPLPQGPAFFQFANEAKASDFLSDAGFEDVRFEDIELSWSLPDKDALYRAFFEGTARTGGILRSMRNDALMEIRKQCALECEALEDRSSGLVKVPMSVKMIIASKV